MFELLQNADNNSYTKAAALGEEPYLSFHLFHHRIIVECNEDGFTNDDLEAICSPSKSSRRGHHGHAAEKDIGFQSVFKAAWKAHIQSGHFSFSFSRLTDDAGAGKIVPRWEEPDDEEVSMTRLTLHLLGTEDTENLDLLRKLHDTIRKRFLELPQTILLFMKKCENDSFCFSPHRRG